MGHKDFEISTLLSFVYQGMLALKGIDVTKNYLRRSRTIWPSEFEGILVAT
jgi:hypothetical protein